MDVPAEVRTAVGDRLEPVPAAGYLALARPSVGFGIRPDERGCGSVIGGEPRGGPFEWPEYEGEPMLLLAQVDCAEVAGLLGPAWPFPADGYLLFFHDDEFVAPFDPEHGDDGCRVLHVATFTDDDAEDDAEDFEDSADEDEDDEEYEVVTTFLDAAAMVALPDFDDHDDAAGFDAAGEALSSGVYEEVRKLLPSPRHRLLGWCDTGTPRPRGLRPLLQVEAEEGTAWGEVVNVSFWIRDDDLRAGRLDRVRRAYEVA